MVGRSFDDDDDDDVDEGHKKTFVGICCTIGPLASFRVGLMRLT